MYVHGMMAMSPNENLLAVRNHNSVILICKVTDVIVKIICPYPDDHPKQFLFTDDFTIVIVTYSGNIHGIRIYDDPKLASVIYDTRLSKNIVNRLRYKLV